MRDFRKLRVWNDGIRLAVQVHGLTEHLRTVKAFALCSQMERAAISIPSNLAEGSGRRTNNDRAHFFDIAYGSACELETQIHIAEAIAPHEEWEKIRNRTRSLARSIHALREAVRSQNQKPTYPK